MTTTKEMIAVMEAFEAGKPIEYINDDLGVWEPCYRPSWDWFNSNYRIAVTKPSWDWSHVSDRINYLVRHSPSFGGGGMGTSHRPIKGENGWHPREGRAYDVECLASYNPGTCDWQDSLVVRPGYVEGAE